MRHLIILLTIALSVAISSCRSSRQSNVAYTDTASVVSSATEGTHTAGDILSLLSVSREFDLSGIKIEFFPPDSAHPDSRAVETAKVKDTSEQAIHEQVDVDGQKTVNLSAQSHTGLEHDTKSDADFARPADWVLVVSIIGAIIIFIVTLLIKSKK